MELPTFFGHLAETVAGLVGARRVAFWRFAPDGPLHLQREPFGLPAQAPIRNLRIDLTPDGDGIVERIVFRDQLDIRDGTCPALDEFWRTHGLKGFQNSIAVSWPAGGRRIGALAAFDSNCGFTTDDARVLRVAAMAAGLVWQYRETEAERDVAVERLAKAMGARRQLLANGAAGGGQAPRRLASALQRD